MIEQLNDTVDQLYRSRIAAALEHKEGVDLVVAFAETYLGLVTSSHPIEVVPGFVELEVAVPRLRPAVW